MMMWISKVWKVLLIPLICLLQYSSATSSPEITLLPNKGLYNKGDKLKIQCKLNTTGESINSGSIQLYCPLVESTVACFMDCQPTCTQGLCAQLLGSVHCEGKIFRSSRLREYTIPLEDDHFQGTYSCVYRGVHSDRRSIAILNDTIVTSNTQISTSPSKNENNIGHVTTQISDIYSEKSTNIYQDSSTSIVIPFDASSKEDSSTSIVIPFDASSKEEDIIQLQIFLVISASFALMISLCLNMYCILRTCLLNHYIKYSNIKPKMTGFFCMAEELNTRRQRITSTHPQQQPTAMSSEFDYCPMRPAQLNILSPTVAHLNNSNLYSGGSVPVRFHPVGNSPRPSLEANTFYPDNTTPNNFNSQTFSWRQQTTTSSHSSE